MRLTDTEYLAKFRSCCKPLRSWNLFAPPVAQVPDVRQTAHFPPALASALDVRPRRKVQHAYPIDLLKTRIKQLDCHIHCA